MPGKRKAEKQQQYGCTKKDLETKGYTEWGIGQQERVFIDDLEL